MGYRGLRELKSKSLWRLDTFGTRLRGLRGCWGRVGR